MSGRIPLSKLIPAANPEDLTDEDEERSLIASGMTDGDIELVRKDIIDNIEPCDAEVWERPDYMHRHRCPHPGKRWVNNKWLCGIHAKVEDRRAARRYG